MRSYSQLEQRLFTNLDKRSWAKCRLWRVARQTKGVARSVSGNAEGKSYERPSHFVTHMSQELATADEI